MAGRPTVVTENVLALLKEAFEWGCTDREACLHAEIDEATLYRYQESNPEYAIKKKAWKERPILKARKCVVEALEADKELSLKYLERKKKDEFSLRSENVNTLKNEDGETLKIELDVKTAPIEKIDEALDNLLQ